MTAPDAHADRRAVALAACLLVATTTAAMCTAAGAELTLREFPLDDAWIHQVYARSLVRDAALAYNPGTPEAGFSSLLWLLASVPAQLAAAKAGTKFAPPVVPDSPWRSGANTLIASAQKSDVGLIADVVGGACDPHPWRVDVRWTEDLVVLHAVPDAPLVDLSVLGRLGPRGCTSNAVISRVPVPLDRPLDGRLVVDAWSGAVLVPPQVR